MRLNRLFSWQTAIDKVEHNMGTGGLSLPQPAAWTKRLVFVILLGLTAAGTWSVLARVDVVIAAQGKLEPLSQSQAVQSKVGGVVTTVAVREGQRVKQGDLLLQLDKAELRNQLQSLLVQQDLMVTEVAVLQQASQGASASALIQSGAKISPELLNRVETRSLLVAQISGDPSGLSPEQFQRYNLFQQQMQDRLAINELQGSSLQAQVAATESQLAQTEFQRDVEQKLVSQLQPLLEQGAISRTEFLQRVVGINALQSQANQGDLQRSQLQLNQIQTQVQTRQQISADYQNLQSQLAALDAEFDATIKNNQQQLIQIASQINQIQLNLKDQDLHAPADGVVFNLGPKLPGMVAQPGQVLLQVVPSETLTARVQVANTDIANIRQGMPVDVRIDAYPFTEFGAVQGTVSQIGNEAVRNEQTAGQAVFPVEVQIDQQFLSSRAKPLTLTPGMTLIANIKVRSRAPISYVADELIRAFDGMQSIR
ncbi:MAG: HlyD family type I secretion periplasmic adaptor subunit [Oscillatoriophycideae cyanobacterium NC_groundwater_1537_Pr4_S-0.65um_50_18]|nr:HlyD family type I secretion periplasmic adaptor subunit [Oscillatoriophycideae cyanobacterium NC_groundwater_1537_Pr4_S-0.65um_50_18]